MNVQAFVFAGVSPKEIACSAWTLGVETQFTHLYAQFGCFAWAASIQVSAQPGAPSAGINSLTATLSACRLLVCSGQAAPIATSPFLNSSTSSAAAVQYFLINGRCCLRRLTAAPSCASVSSYGSVMPRFGC